MKSILFDLDGVIDSIASLLDWWQAHAVAK